MSAVNVVRGIARVTEDRVTRHYLAITPVAGDDVLDLVVTVPDAASGRSHQTITTVRAVDLLRDIMLEVPASQGVMLLEGVEEPMPLPDRANAIVVAPHGGVRFDITTTTVQEAADMAVFWAGVARRRARLDAETAALAEAKAREEAEAAKAAHEAHVEQLARKLFVAAGGRRVWDELEERGRDVYRNMAAVAIDELETD